jgi:hypothetical protein
MAYRGTQLIRLLREVDFAAKAGLEVVPQQRRRIGEGNIRFFELGLAPSWQAKRKSL